VTTLRIEADEEGMRNLYPLAARARAEVDVAEAQGAWVRDRATGRGGWSESHLAKHPVSGYLGAAVDPAACAAAVGAHLPRIRDFGVGDEPASPFYRRETDAHCYGFGDEVFVKFELADGTLASIWFDAMTGDDERLRALRRALVAINAVVPSVIADFWLEAVGAVADGEFMDRYFVALGLEKA